MRDSADVSTVELFPIPKQRGGLRKAGEGKKLGAPKKGRETIAIRVDVRLLPLIHSANAILQDTGIVPDLP